MLRLHRTLSLMGRKRKRLCLDVGATGKATPLAAAAAAESKLANLRTTSSSSTIWTTPKKGRLKLNFDGSSTTDFSSIGGVYRDHKGSFVLGYAQRIRKVTSSVAELLALKRGLELAVKYGWRDISIEGDFESAVHAITSRSRFRAKNDLKEYTKINAMLPQLGETTMSDVLRKGNKVADRFAKLGHDAAVQRVWRDVPPDEVLQHLERDAVGK